MRAQILDRYSVAHPTSVYSNADRLLHVDMSDCLISKSFSCQRDTDKISGYKSITSHLIEVSQAVISAASACHKRTGTSEVKLLQCIE
jgi:hypothetical protein